MAFCVFVAQTRGLLADCMQLLNSMDIFLLARAALRCCLPALQRRTRAHAARRRPPCGAHHALPGAICPLPGRQQKHTFSAYPSPVASMSSGMRLVSPRGCLGAVARHAVVGSHEHGQTLIPNPHAHAGFLPVYCAAPGRGGCLAAIARHATVGAQDHGHTLDTPLTRLDMQVFFPYVALYLGASFLQGGAGTGASGFLNNLRNWLWFPISQDAYRTIALDLFSHVLDLDLKFHLMCASMHLRSTKP